MEERKAKDAKIMEKRLLPNDDKQELCQRFYTLKQGKRIVAEYILEFHDLKIKSGVKEEKKQTIARFIGGLYRKIAKEVELKQHKKLGEVYKCALEVDRQRAIAKMSSSKPCTTLEPSVKCEVSDAEKESTKPSVPPPPPPPPMSHDMPPPPPKHDLPPPSPINQELLPPPSSPTHKLQQHVEENGGFTIELSKNDEVSDEKGSYKEEVVIERIMLELIAIEGKLKPFELLKWFSEQRLEINIFKVGNCYRLRWENLKRVKMKEPMPRSFNY